MQLSDLDKLTDIVRELSAKYILPFYQKVQHEKKDDGSILTEVDTSMQNAVEQALTTNWPQFVVLGEEMPVEQQLDRLNNAEHGTWVLDPLDGTGNFSAGIPVFSVSIALVEKGEVTVGVVYDPVRDECFTALKGQGSYLNGERLDLSGYADDEDILIGVVDFKRLNEAQQTKLIRSPLYKSQRSFGSVALDWAWLAAARGHIYVHGSQNMWDYAAGYLIFNEAGGSQSTLDGEDVFNGELVKRSAVCAINAKMHKAWLAYLQSA